MNQPLVSVITVNYRQTGVTCELLQSIQQLNQYPNLEVIVVDNAPLEDSCKPFKTAYPGAKVLISRENLGFAGGNNLGIQVANGAYILLLNNDTEWSDGLVENLLARFEKSPKTGAVSPKIKYFHRPQTIQYAGFTPVNPITGRNRLIGKNEADEGQFDLARPTAYAHGAAMMISREAIKKAGLMPETYFLYYEELDWSLQIKNKGFEIWYEPAATVLHKESITTGKDSPLKVFYQTRNRFLFIRRNFQTWQATLFCLYFFCVTFPAKTVGYLWNRSSDQLLNFWNGALKGISTSPVIALQSNKYA